MADKSPREQIYEALCRETGLPHGTDGDIVLASYVGAWRARAVAAGLAPDANVPEITAAEHKARDAVRLAGALRTAAGTVGGHANGVKLMSKDEAVEHLLFGGENDLTRRRVECTENYFGKSLRQAIVDRDLR